MCFLMYFSEMSDHREDSIRQVEVDAECSNGNKVRRP